MTVNNNSVTQLPKEVEECRLLGYKNPVHTSQETLRLRYRAQPVNAM
jgi:hypothetical protein